MADNGQTQAILLYHRHWESDSFMYDEHVNNGWVLR